LIEIDEPCRDALKWRVIKDKEEEEEYRKKKKDYIKLQVCIELELSACRGRG
jgi:hypothetical protein